MLPESQDSLEQAFDIRLELRPVLTLHGEVRLALDRLREAESLAERLNDDRRRGQVCVLVMNCHSLLGELDEAMVTGTRALAGRLEDLSLRIPATSYLEQAHYLRGEYERVIELATENLGALPTDWVFCGGCGARLGTPQPIEAKFTSPDAYTPPHLAEKILTSKAALEGERKQVTVLFADLKGSMELLADRDPEEARKLLDPVLERMMDAVHRYEGTVNQVMGMGSWRCSALHSPMKITPCGPATQRCGCRSQSGSTRRGSSARTGCRCTSAWGSTPAR